MSLTEDDELVRELSVAVNGVPLSHPGPDIGRIRRRGTARRRRHHALVTTGLAGVLVLAGTVVLTVDDQDSLDGTGLAGAAAGKPLDQTSDEGRVAALIDGVLEEAGIAGPTHPEDLSAGLITAGPDGETGEEVLWAKRWRITTGQLNVAVNVVISPQQARPDAAYPCSDGAQEQVRACRDDVLDNGVRLLSGEYSTGALSVGADLWSLWSPTALAVPPDGRQVSMTVGMLAEEGHQLPPGVVTEDYPTPITTDQLRAVVTHPDLARIGPP